MIWFVVGLLVFLVQIVIILVLEFRHPTKTIAWIMILFVLPIVGFGLYYFVAREYKTKRLVKEMRGGTSIWQELQRRRPKLSMHDLLGDKTYQRLYHLLDHIAYSQATNNNEVEIYKDPAHAYDSILEAMEQAEDHIHVEYYTIRDDEIGRKFQQLWIRKAKEGVSVRVIYDGVGSYSLNSRYLEPLRQAGVEMKSFLPPWIAFLDKRINYRNHRKIVVVDGRAGFTGGVNIGDEYLGKNPKLGYWRDTHIRIYGDAVYDLQRIFLEDWLLVSGERVDSPFLIPEPTVTGSDQVQVIMGGPDSKYDPILEVYFTAITLAQKRIYVTTPYFIPDPSVFTALKTAAVCGVDVRVIIPCVPDSKLVYYASLSYLTELMQAGVRFFRYERGFVHAKTLLVDDVLGCVGTANMDMRSFFSNFELNALFYDASLIKRLEQDFHSDLKDCTELKLEKFRHRSRWHKCKEVISRLLSPLF